MRWEKERAVRLRERKREREGAESQYWEEREKIIKKLYTHATMPVQIWTGTIATCKYTQVYTHWCGCFFAQNV